MSLSLTMHPLLKHLEERGHGRVPSSAIRFAEERGHIPPADRNWRGWRVYSERHVEAIEAYLNRRRTTTTC